MGSQIDDLRNLNEQIKANPVIGSLRALKTPLYRLLRPVFARLFLFNDHLIEVLADMDQRLAALNAQAQQAQPEAASPAEPDIVRPAARWLDHDYDEPVIEPPHPAAPEEAQAFIARQKFWYHRIYLGNGIYTAPERLPHEAVWNTLKPMFPASLAGVSVLDIGCNAGYFSLKLAARGASRMLGVESVAGYYEQALFCRDVWDADIEYRLIDAHELTTLEEQFDIVLFLGILYHLKNPLQVLEFVSRVCTDAIVIETEIIPADPRNLVYAAQGAGESFEIAPQRRGFMKFVEGSELNNDQSNWWIPDTECVMGMLRTVGFRYFSTPIEYAGHRLLLAASRKPDSILDLSQLR